MPRVTCPYCSRRFDSFPESYDHLAASHEPMLQATDVPPLAINPISERAVDTAETLLSAFYLQDEREAHIIREDGPSARATAAAARDRMVETYEREFPHVDADRVEAAGDAFARALFLHDEIENWEFIEQLLDSDGIESVLLSDTTASYGAKPARDPRWERVNEQLAEVCRQVDIDPAYADKQTQFWRLHGQIHEYWEEVAHEAHTIKLRAMVPTAPDDIVDDLAQYFVAGVKLHDQWGHQHKDRDLARVIDLVAKYYQKVFEMRAGGRPEDGHRLEHYD